jgi:signal transduction histidine kinase
MHTPLLVGMLAGVALASGGMAAFFVRAWLGRRQDTQYLLFGLSTLAWGVIALAEALFYWQAIDPAVSPSLSTLVTVAMVPGNLAAALLLHFALRQAQVRRERTIMLVVYSFEGLFLVVALAAGMWAHVPQTFERFSLLGFEFHRLQPELSTMGKIYVACVPLTLLAVVALLARTGFRDGARGNAAFYGSVVMALSLFHDAAIAARWIDSVPLLPMGMFTLGFGVGLNLVARYAGTATALAANRGELEQRGAQLDAAYRELKRTQKRLVEKEQLAAMGELAAVVAHEVRNPLAVVSNAVASLQKGRVPGDQRRLLLTIIDEEMDRLEKLVSHLLDYARPVEPNPVELNLRDLLERSMSLLQDRPKVKQALEVAHDVPKLSGDPDLLRQAFENVVVNAAQAMHNEGSLRVRAKRENVDGVEGVAVDFADNGEGMSDDAQLHALAPFFTTRPTGTGLGLPIVGRIVEAHGGAVDIMSELGEGTTIRLHLPIDGGSRLRERKTRGHRTSLLP